jgi:hypothetical protein
MAVFSRRPDHVEGKNMTKNVWFLGLLVCVLALGALLAGCETSNSTGADKDKWSPVTSLSQLDGTWKFSYTETQTLAEWAAGAESIMDYLGEGDLGFDFDIKDLASMGIDPGKVRVTVKGEGTQTINANAKTLASAGTAAMTFSGDGSDLIILGLLVMISEMPDGVSVDAPNKSVAMDISSKPEPLDSDTIADLLANTQISQDGKKIKLSVPGLGSREIIATKQ